MADTDTFSTRDGAATAGAGGGGGGGDELVDLVRQTLESAGTLSAIRAQLRASVYLALENSPAAKAAVPFKNERLASVLSTSGGLSVMRLIVEFMEWCELHQTSSVLLPEAHISKKSRAEILADIPWLQKSNNKKARGNTPLLLDLFNYAAAATAGTAVPVSSVVPVTPVKVNMASPGFSPPVTSHLSPFRSGGSRSISPPLMGSLGGAMSGTPSQSTENESLRRATISKDTLELKRASGKLAKRNEYSELSPSASSASGENNLSQLSDLPPVELSISSPGSRDILAPLISPRRVETSSRSDVNDKIESCGGFMTREEQDQLNTEVADLLFSNSDVSSHGDDHANSSSSNKIGKKDNDNDDDDDANAMYADESFGSSIRDSSKQSDDISGERRFANNNVKHSDLSFSNSSISSEIEEDFPDGAEEDFLSDTSDLLSPNRKKEHPRSEIILSDCSASPLSSSAYDYVEKPVFDNEWGMKVTR